MERIDLITFSNMAEACKVSRQTIYNLVNQLEGNPEYNELVTVKDNVKHLTAKGQEYIREKLGLNIEPEEEEDKEPEEATKADAGDEYKDKYIKLLEEQIKIKDGQIKALNIAIEEMQARQKEANILTALERKGLIETADGEYIEAEENKEPEEVKETPRRGFKGFIDRLLGRG